MRIVCTAVIRFAIVAFFAVASPLQAQNQRSFVSTGGSDANACTLSSPCRSFGAAMGVTATGGEIVALDSGGYGPFEIDRSVRIIAPEGVHAAITVFSGEGITVDSGPGSTVVIRGLWLSGLGGSYGIFLLSGDALQLDRVTMDGFGAAGLIVAPGATSTTTKVAATGIRLTNNAEGASFLTGASGSFIRLLLTDSYAVGQTGNGITFGGGVSAVLRNVVASQNGNAGVALTEVADRGNDAFLEACTLTGNNRGLAMITADAFLRARLSGCTIVDNNVGIEQSTGSQIESFLDNILRGNGTDLMGSGPSAVGALCPGGSGGRSSENPDRRESPSRLPRSGTRVAWNLLERSRAR